MEGKTEGLSPKPTDEVRIEDLKNKNFSTFTYNKESDIPDIVKDKITSKRTTNGKTEIRVTLPKSEADYYLNKIIHKLFPKPTTKRKQMVVILN